MKSEERHELQENELAGWIYHVPHLLNKYGSYLLFAVALLLLAFQGYGYYQRSQERKREEAWSQLDDASLPGAVNPPLKLQNLMTGSEVKPVRAMAGVVLGDFYLDTLTFGAPPEGSNVKVTPEVASAEAQKAYEGVLKDYPDQDLAVVRAYLGLGKLYENRKEWDKAAQQYDTVKTLGSRSATIFAGYAEERRNHLKEWAQPVNFGAPVATQPAALPERTSTSEPATTGTAH